MPQKNEKKNKDAKIEKVKKNVTEESEIKKLTLKGDESLQELVKKNIKWSQIIYKQNKKIKRRLNWMAFGNYFRLFIIIIPIIFAFFYLPSFVKDLLIQYSGLLSNDLGVQIRESINLLQQR